MKSAGQFVEIFWRLESMGKYKHGKPNKEITLEEFQEALDSKKFADPLMHAHYYPSFLSNYNYDIIIGISS